MRAEIMGRWVMRAALLVALACGAGCYEAADEVGGESHFLRPCERQAQCDDLGSEFSCVAGFCRMASDPAAAPRIEDDPSGEPPAGAMEPMAGDPAIDGPVDPATPLVLLLVDTSGSTERMASCTCTTSGCEECLPDCSRGDRNRFTNMLESLTGTFEDFSCETISRQLPEGVEPDPETMPYDTGYYLPYNRPQGPQRDDGLLDQYRDRLRFGLATFDGWDTWAGAPPLVPARDFDFARSQQQQGLWSYNPAHDIPGFASPALQPSGAFRYPHCAAAYFMDTGIRGVTAEQGALQVATDPSRAGSVNDAIQRSLLAVRPYGGTPIASSLDDLYYLFSQDPMLAEERARGTEIHVVLITDGYPDDDYRSFGCNCAREGDPSDSERCGGDNPAAMSCPYPTPEDAARVLRCGQGGSACAGAVAQVHVVAFSVDDVVVTTKLDAIAVQGGGQGAHFAADALSLRRELDDVLATIVQR